MYSYRINSRLVSIQTRLIAAACPEVVVFHFVIPLLHKILTFEEIKGRYRDQFPCDRVIYIVINMYIVTKV